MEIPKTLHEEWLLLKEHGDIKAIHQLSKVSEPIIREALKTGKGSDRTMGAINNYYVQKRKRQADKLKDMSERLLQL
jgi:hypothetical protein